MKVAELREELGKHEVEALRALAESLYRMMPARLREEKGADEVVRRPLAAKTAPRPRKPAVPDPDTALEEANFFVEHAWQQHYFAPNTFVRKKERAAWRFVAGRAYRNLLALLASEVDRKEAAGLLVELYRVLCRGEQVYLFPSTQPFEALRVKKQDMLRSVLQAARTNLPTDEYLDLLLELVTNGTWFHEQLGLAAAAVDAVPSPELRERLAERATAAFRGAGVDVPPQRERRPQQPKGPTPPSEQQRLLAVLVALAHHANREPERGLAAHRKLLGEYADAHRRDLAYVLPDVAGEDR
jgi:hypothetical protein